MGSYAHISGTIACDHELDVDFEGMLAELPLEDLFLVRNDGEDYHFSFSIREPRLHLLYDVLKRLEPAKSLDWSEWEPIELDMLIRFETDGFRVDHVQIRWGELQVRTIPHQEPQLPDWASDNLTRC